MSTGGPSQGANYAPSGSVGVHTRPDGASALAPPDAGIAAWTTAAARRVLSAWSRLTWMHFGWALCIGAIVGLLFTTSHGVLAVFEVLVSKTSFSSALWESTIAVGVSALVSCLSLCAVSVAEHGDHGQTRAWLRYAFATLAAAGASTAVVHIVSPYVSIAGLIGWYRLRDHFSIDMFLFANWLLFGGLAVFVYVRLRRLQRRQAEFERAELERAGASRNVLRAQLATLQAQVEPAFLFNALSQIEALYDRDIGNAERLLDALIDYLHAVLPTLRGANSTLARETELVSAYLRIVQTRMGSRLEPVFDVPPELAANPFPPMLLLPLIDNALRHGIEPLPLGGRIVVRATASANRLRLDVSDNGLGNATDLREGGGLTALRARLAGLFGQSATLRFSAAQPHGVIASIEVPV
jgi:Histidine kinase